MLFIFTCFKIFDGNIPVGKIILDFVFLKFSISEISLNG